MTTVTGPTSLTVTTTGDGRLVVVKTARGPAMDRLRHEAAVSAALTGAAVPEVLAVEEDVDRVRLVTSHAGGRTLADPGDLEFGEALELAAALADAMAEVHDLRWAHTALDADHVVIDGAGRPTICSWGRAARLDGLEADTAVTADVRALTGIARDLLDRSVPSTAPWSPTGRLRRRRVEQALQRTLPDARSVADALRSGGPGTGDAAAPGGTNRRRPRALAIGAAAGAVLTVALGLAVGFTPDDSPTGPPVTADTVATPFTTSTTAPDPAPSTAPLPVDRPWDTDGDGRADEVSIGTDPDGTLVITVNSRRYLLDGAVAATLGDWNGDGIDTPAVVERGGDVLAFDRWGDGVAGRVVGRAPGATALVTVRLGTLEVPATLDDTGAPHPVGSRHAPPNDPNDREHP